MKIKNLKSAYFVGMYLFVAAIMTATAGYGSSTNGTNGMVQKPAPPPLDSATPALSGYQLYPGQQILPGTTPPAGIPFTYTVTITDTTGTWTTSTTVSCFQKEFVTNISPAGTVTATAHFAGLHHKDGDYAIHDQRMVAHSPRKRSGKCFRYAECNDDAYGSFHDIQVDIP